MTQLKLFLDKQKLGFIVKKKNKQKNKTRLMENFKVILQIGGK